MGRILAMQRTVTTMKDDRLISLNAAIDALDEQIRQCDKALSAFDISMKDEYAVKVERASLVAFRETLEYMPPAQPERWIQCTERMPDNEHDVLVTVEIRPVGRKPFRRVVRAFYTDGKHTDADSAYSWDEFPDPQYDDDDNLIIPEGWWESSDYLEQQGMIDDFVIAWREPLKPWKGEQP